MRIKYCLRFTSANSRQMTSILVHTLSSLPSLRGAFSPQVQLQERWYGGVGGELTYLIRSM